ncbi:hypothetical protein [Micromonospora carbonacea]|uniref:Uncharacterized protein n=1 Tax=Micromonospora carbonacea TaxID=47853 RepID=A0A7H8XM68_9ACTN|nr:hypothetical protein [Micromonospora carbonacea]MBB5826198.1 hypothetical protein [Micromonospora carbonacea]QLD25750.1 hypothetical protein HXZ27_17330 [Micromonospora carbonacea]
MLDQASVLAMFRNHRTPDRRLADLIAHVVGAESVPAEVQVTVMPGESIYYIYFGRRITAGEAGIEVVGIDSFMEVMSGHRGREVGLFRVGSERGWLLAAFDLEARELLACVGKFTTEKDVPLAR